jgi:hypothetical protein
MNRHPPPNLGGFFIAPDHSERKTMTKDQIVKAIRLCTRKLKRNPNLRDLRLIGVSEMVLYKRFGGLAKALAAAGLEATGPGFNQPEAALLLDWAAVTRKLGKIPSVHEYSSAGRFSVTPFQTRYRRWGAVPQAFSKFAHESKIGSAWQDVLRLAEAHAHKEHKTVRAFLPPRIRKGPVFRDRPIYGGPLQCPELAHEPLNELGVVFVFGILARRLGFVVHRIQPDFPDCEAMREVARGQWQRVRIEFEYESRNFLRHRHQKERCDLIICWRHNWPECPASLQVLDLSKALQEWKPAS